MAAVEAVGGARVEIHLAFHAGEQQGVRQRLRVGVGELRVVRVGEEEVAPFACQLGEGASRYGDRRPHLLAEKARERRQQLRERTRRRRHERPPAEEVAEQDLERNGIRRAVRGSAVGTHVAVRRHSRADERAVAVERPLVPVRETRFGWSDSRLNCSRSWPAEKSLGRTPFPGALSSR